MKHIILVILLVLPFIVGAQKLTPAAQSLVDAEWAFINEAKEKNTRDAFVANFSNETLVWGKDSLVNANALYENLKPNESYLAWKPLYTDIALSGDMGYNTGPWEFRNRKTDQEAIAHGQFISVWKKDKDNQWKLAIDLGISFDSTVEQSETLLTSRIKTKRIKESSDAAKASMLREEHNLIQQLNVSSPQAYHPYLSTETKLFRSGNKPLTRYEDVNAALSKQDEARYFLLRGEVSKAGDFGYTCGTARVKLADGSLKKAGYLRVWKRENGKSWKVIADVLSYR